MCDEERALLAGIRAEPEDDTARLVYADWLQEHDRPDRAEMIRVMVRRPGRWIFVSRSDPLKHHSPTLVRPRGVQFPRLGSLCRAEWRAGYERLNFHRGFAEQVACPFVVWANECFGLLGAHPVRHVRLSAWPTTNQLAALYPIGYPDARIPVFVGNLPAPDQIAEFLARCWPGVVFEVPATYRGYPVTRDWLRDHTTDDLTAMREAGRRLAQRMEERAFAALFARTPFILKPGV